MVGACGSGGDCSGVSAGIWVIHTGAKSGCKVVTLFDSYFILTDYVIDRLSVNYIVY